MKYAAISAKIIRTVKCLPNILYRHNIDIIDLRLFPCFCILFKKQLESITGVFISLIVLTGLNISEPIDAS